MTNNKYINNILTTPSQTDQTIFAEPALDKKRPQKHQRYISEWESSVIKIDATQKRKKQKCFRTFDLGSIKLNLIGGSGIYDGIYTLKDFPQYLEILKIGINNILFNFDNGAPASAATQFINNSTRVIIWLLRKGIYNFSDLTRDLIDDLITKFAKTGWYGVLPYQTLLNEVKTLIGASEEITAKFVNTSSRQGCTLRVENIRDHIGMPLEAHELPTALTDEAQKVTGIAPARKGEVHFCAAPKAGAFNSLLSTLNALALLPHGDSITFLPFANVSKTVKEKLNTPEKRSRNLSLKDAVKILKAACTGVLDLAAPITELAEYARGLLENRAENSERITDSYEARLGEKLQEFRTRYKNPVPNVWADGRKPSFVLTNLVEYVQTSAGILMTFSHGLRSNDAAGAHGSHWGAYLGCVTSVEGFPDAKKIEFFISKNLNDYAHFWCGKLVQKCVKAMELLAQSCRPAGTPRISLKNTVEEMRKDKLFTQLKFNNTGFLANRRILSLGESCKNFLDMIGLNRDVLDRPRAFRRLFCILYVYRYDDTSISALSQRMFHYSLQQTEWYFTNGDGRKYSETVEAMFRDRQALLKEMAQVRHEKFASTVTDYLKGKPVGGGLPALIRKTIRSLSASVKFITLSAAAKGNAVASKMEKDGYSLIERRNGECLVGNTKKHSREVNCTRGGVAHPEDASFGMCTGCVVNQTTPNYIQGYVEDLRDLERDSSNFKIPKVIRIAKAQQASDLKDVIAANYSLCRKNQASLAKLVEDWNVIVKVDDASKEVIKERGSEQHS